MKVTFHIKYSATIPPSGRKKKPTSEIRETDYEVDVLEFNSDEVPRAHLAVGGTVQEDL